MHRQDSGAYNGTDMVNSHKYFHPNYFGMMYLAITTVLMTEDWQTPLPLTR